MPFREKELFRRTASSELNQALTRIEQLKQVYGEYQKTLIHFHTPASHDYKFVRAPKYLRENESVRLFTSYDQSEVDQIATDFDLFKFARITHEYLDKMVEKNSLFETVKELEGYLLIALKLYLESVRVAVITDHNTVAGYDRLKDAINIIKRCLPNKQVPSLLFGVEISCGDSLHVVGITDNSSKSRSLVTEFLTTNILSENAGTYLPSWEVVEWFKKHGFISYVAHINTSDVFKLEYGSGAYKKRLFSAENMQVVGVSKIEKQQGVLRQLRNHNVTCPVVFLDEDSHCLEDLATKTFWIKGQELDYNMLRNAIEDSDVSLKFDRPELPDVFIKSVSIDGDGFLGKSDSPFSVSFSTALNCVIGGRGTGKSTLLDCVSFVLSQHVRDLTQLKNICKQGKILLTLSVEGKIYYVAFNPAMDGVRDDAFMRGYLFGQEHQLQYHDRMEDTFDEEKVTKATRDKIQIFSLHDDAIYEVIEKTKFFNRVFRSSYSVNELVKKASDRHITSFIESQLNSTSMKVSKIRAMSIENDQELRKQAGLVNKKLESHKSKILTKIQRINVESKRVRVTYTQKALSSQYFDWFRQTDRDWFKAPKRWFLNYNIDADGLMDLFEKGSDEFGVIGLYLLFRSEDFEKLRPLLLSYTAEISTRDIDNSVEKITVENVDHLLRKIKDKIVRPSRFSVYDLLNQYYRNVDQFDLQFDINSFENDSQMTVFKSISEISLGQKVVALLDFIFMFGAVSGDVTPLLLDQPEDNLDSTYIYQHLVEALRKQKDHRQVLIVTHNSTIVTNSKPEQVISLQSDNTHGWVENTGYPTEAEIVLQIVNLLEGGVASFKHKEFVYSPIIGNISNGAPSHDK
ncbi:hypothetical protein HMPREF0539_0837 [Lacticaseibacillus rhamnosus LMS2-1]|uniref:Rad50/SbcC-type AAA domain-containing protein n=1 Tax=Lacticaseibacillus rhamnosus (strain LMS2-1) TaxID=525361 RepID=C2JVA3_LACRM|nr:AAA family ATPase [Lacticaseibacillus rhamnosus]AER65304.1 recF/RecN/SMC N terminal domain protein [Lacticaseibacillus rhamnosus ATCC 8530]EEN81019.1 hypothetical protein HMPREF0539_0837 [Lacticaseibacillus rhamnosus LMS2-1]